MDVYSIWLRRRYRRANPNKMMRHKTIILRGWYVGIFTDIADKKVSHIIQERFQSIIAAFAPKFKNLGRLACDLRDVLFLKDGGGPFTGTFEDPNIMYNGMIIAFDRAYAIWKKRTRQMRKEARTRSQDCGWF